jgi:hypothetical protein
MRLEKTQKRTGRQTANMAINSPKGQCTHDRVAVIDNLVDEILDLTGKIIRPRQAFQAANRLARCGSKDEISRDERFLKEKGGLRLRLHNFMQSRTVRNGDIKLVTVELPKVSFALKLNASATFSFTYTAAFHQHR